MLFDMDIEEVSQQNIPPPSYLAELPVMVQLVIVGLLPSHNIPPPFQPTAFPVIMQSIIFGLQSWRQ